ncbi:MAG: hypothetical protein JW864_09115 [Spirochaetes bacterium]|nr:hypothetical protein [Spirochaetota bacterium]
MQNRTSFILSILISCIILTGFKSVFASVQHGTVFSLAYFPFGYGRMNVPYADAVAGTANTLPEEGSSFKSAGKYSVSAGYFYASYQADLSYESATIRNQLFDNSSLGDEIIEAERTVFLLRGGKRFSDPGDSTYHYLYFGLKRMSSCSDYEDLELAAYGYLAGYEGFYTFGIKSSIEFAVKFNAFIGTYRKESFDSDLQFENIDRKNSVTAGAELGIGFLYEPEDVAVLLKFSNDFDQIAYNAEVSGSNLDFAYRIQGSYLGIEVVYSIPNFKYNKR